MDQTQSLGRLIDGLDFTQGPLRAVDTGPEARGDSRPGARQDAPADVSPGLGRHNG